MDCLKLKTEAYAQRLIHLAHIRIVKTAHFFTQPPFIDRPYLLKQHHAVLCKSAVGGVHFNMGRKIRLIPLRGYGGGYDRGRISVSHIVLHNKYGPYPALF